MKKPDLVSGTIFQQLTILRKAERKGTVGRSYYICQCNYGKMDYSKQEYIDHCRAVTVFQEAK